VLLVVNGYYSDMFCNSWKTLWFGDEKPNISSCNAMKYTRKVNQIIHQKV